MTTQMSVLHKSNGGRKNTNAPTSGASHGLESRAISEASTNRETEYTLPESPLHPPIAPAMAVPSEARQMTAETGQALKKRLNRATLRHLRPGPEMELALDAGGDPSIPPRGRKGRKNDPGRFIHGLSTGLST